MAAPTALRPNRNATGAEFEVGPIFHQQRVDISPAFSPDGSLVAYASDRTGSLEIYVRHRGEEGRELRLTSDGQNNLQPSFSPEGRSIVFCSMNGGIFRIPALGGTIHKLVDFGSYPSWSPDGSTIVFRSAGITTMGTTDMYFPTESNIWTVPAAGGTPRQLTTSSNPDGVQHFPTWGPDGKQIRFVNYSKGHFAMWTCEYATGNLRKLFDSADGNLGNARFTPDDKAMYYVKTTLGGDIGIRKMTIDPSTLQPIGEPVYVLRPSLGVPRDLAISPDGKHAAFSVILSSSGISSIQTNPHDLSPVGEPKPLTTEAQFRYSQPKFSPDGRTIAFTSWRKGGKGTIWLAARDGSDLRLILAEASYFPWFHPDRKSLYYVANENGFKDVKAVSLEDGSSRLLSSLGASADFISYSPDGKEIVFNSYAGAVVQLWKMDLTTRKRQQLTFGAVGSGFGHYSPDGESLSFQVLKIGGAQIAVMPVAGGTPEILYSAPGLHFASEWAPDNDKILFASLQHGAWNVYWISRTTRQVRQLTNYHSIRSYVRYPVMSPNSDQVVFEFNESKGNVFTADLQ